MTSTTARTAIRFEALDALRGFAMVWMAAFHFAFDLNLHGLIEPRQRFNADPFWTMQRTVIVTLFLFCAGFGQALAHEAGQPAARFWRRWAQVAACALAVSIGSYLMFPRSYIYFGVLHGMAVMLVVARYSAGAGRWLWLLGAIAIALPHVARHPVFDAKAWHFLGLLTRRPVTEDYVPLLPWLGVMWWGLAAGQAWLGRQAGAAAGAVRSVGSGEVRRKAWQPRAALAALGRWPLTFYMLHQPIFLGGLMLYLAWRGR
jgi:uncharacterized membrane protein